MIKRKNLKNPIVPVQPEIPLKPNEKPFEEPTKPEIIPQEPKQIPFVEPSKPDIIPPEIPIQNPEMDSSQLRFE